MKPDVIVSWPRSCDFPLWRQFVHDERERFARVLVCFTEHDGPDYAAFVSEVMALDGVECFRSPLRGSRDWRDVAVNACLDRSDAEWVWFTEQDFFIPDPVLFWDVVEWKEHASDAIGWIEPPRWHPSCLFVRRSAIEKTDRYFGTEPVDHFYSFGRQLSLCSELGPVPYEHLQGVTQNHSILDHGGTLDSPGIFAPERFSRYLADSLAVTVPLHPGWVRAVQPYAGAGLRRLPHPVSGGCE